MLLNKKKDIALIYTYWNWENPTPFDLDNPLILSISTARYFSKKVKIYVIDYSTKNINWNGLPNELNFEILKTNSIFFRAEEIYGKWPAQRRPQDIRRISEILKEDIIFYCDNDVMWLDTPENFMPFKFHLLYNSSGFFYYDKNHNDSIKFLDFWCKLCNDIITFDNYGNFQIQGIGVEINKKYNRLDEEVVFRYFRDLNQYQDFFNKVQWVSLLEQMPLDTYLQNPSKTQSIHFYNHCIKKFSKLKRSEYILKIKDFYEIISKELKDINKFNILPTKSLKELVASGGQNE